VLESPSGAVQESFEDEEEEDFSDFASDLSFLPFGFFSESDFLSSLLEGDAPPFL
jgi:hypothetical protein